MKARLAAPALLLLGLSACATTVRPVQEPNRLTLPPERFDHAAFDRVLTDFVDEEGLVDYAALARRPFDLDAYLGQVAGYSPDRDPALFPDDASRLAYWINAYNAVALRLVIEHYPIASVQEVRGRPWMGLLPEGAGFFFGQQFPLGGRARSLWSLENRVVRRRFVDPRYHFALNCASLGCPVLPRRSFEADRLDAQLGEETARFLAAPRNFRIDTETRTAYLSEIFDWYRGDFEKWQAHRGRAEALLAFVADHAAEPQAGAARRASAEGFTVRFATYDWRLNDQALGPRPPAP